MPPSPSGWLRRPSVASLSQCVRGPWGRGRWSRLELLEARDLPSGVRPDHVLFHGGSAAPLSSPGPTGMTPAQVRHYYGFDQVAFGGGTVGG